MFSIKTRCDDCGKETEIECERYFAVVTDVKGRNPGIGIMGHNPDPHEVMSAVTRWFVEKMIGIKLTSGPDIMKDAAFQEYLKSIGFDPDKE